MRKTFIFIIFSFCIYAHSFNFIEFFDASSFHYKFDSFLGTDYFPHQDDNISSYQEKNIFKAGWNFKVQDNVNIWFDLTYRKRIFNEQLELESTGIAYNVNNWDFIFRSDQLKIGDRSKIFEKNVFSSLYDIPVIEEYNFMGFESIRHFGNYNISGMVGGNSFNSAIGKLNIGYSNEKHDIDVYYLFVKRDRIFTYPMHAIVLETHTNLDKVFIYNSLAYESMISNLTNHPSRERFVDLSEIIFYLHPNFNIGTNFLYTIFEWEVDEEWSSTSFIEWLIWKTSNTISYKYWNADIGFNREINIINSVNILQYWSLATNFSYNNPSIGDDYFILGFQTKIEYEMD